MRQTQLPHPFWSYSLVASQFLWILVLLGLMPLPENKISLLIHLLGVFVGLWALKVMHLGHFNIIPDPMPDIQLVTTGPYQFIRHPMYASILIFFLPPILFTPDWQLVTSYGALLLTLLIKLTYEERLLVSREPHYASYQNRTARLIPKVF